MNLGPIADSDYTDLPPGSSAAVRCHAPESVSASGTRLHAAAGLFFDTNRPDPIALDLVGQSAIVFLVPTDRIKEEFAVISPTIQEWLAGDEIVRQLLKKIRHERILGGVSQ